MSTRRLFSTALSLNRGPSPRLAASCSALQAVQHRTHLESESITSPVVVPMGSEGCSSQDSRHRRAKALTHRIQAGQLIIVTNLQRPRRLAGDSNSQPAGNIAQFAEPPSSGTLWYHLEFVASSSRSGWSYWFKGTNVTLILDHGD